MPGHRKIFIPLAAAWLLAVGFGTRTLLVYANTPGRLAEPPHHRPSQVRAALFVFAHPQCPCSHATMEQLAWVLAHGKQRPDTTVFFYYPTVEGEHWAKTDLWASAQAIPGVRVLGDPDGAAARQFGASTSGQTLLYDPAGHLVFNGGITATRGHVGDNFGSDSLVALLSGATPGRRSTPVFGCSLVSR